MIKRFLVVIFSFLHFLALHGQKCLWPQRNFTGCSVQAIAHRGYSHYFPENTLLALEEAFKRGIKIAEVDVNATRDGHLVLFHDQPTMHRTSSGNGFIENLNLDEVAELDYGFWKDGAFKDTPLTTLEEALLLAERYGAKLYLDTKGFHPDLYAKALENTGVSPDTFLPAISDKEEMLEFKSFCPDTPFIFFGDWEKLLDQATENEDALGINELKASGCYAVEIFFESALFNEEDFQKLRDILHQNEMEIWVFTTNDAEQFKIIADNGVDAIETDLPWEMARMYCNGMPAENPIAPRVTGNWDFHNQTAFGRDVGSQFNFFYLDDDYPAQELEIKKAFEFGLPLLDGQDFYAIRVPALNPGHGLMFYTNFTPKGFADLHYNYTIIMDIYYPASALGSWTSLYQTNPDNFNDADLFISPDGEIGINNEYHGPLTPDTWSRLIISVSRDRVDKYINGKYVGSNEIEGNRWSLINNFPGGNRQGVHLFSDDDGETSELFLSALQLRNYTVSEEEAIRLGGAKAEGISNINSSLYSLENNTAPSQEYLMDWINKVIIIEGDPQNLSGIAFNTQVSAGASFDIDEYAVTVTAEDAFYSSRWYFCFTEGEILSVEENPLFLVYPNPTESVINVSNTSNLQSDLKIFDIRGRNVASFPVNDNNETTIDLTSFSAGTYIIKHGSLSKRFIKK